MLRFDEVIYLSLFLSLFYLKDWRIRCFTILKIRKYSIYSVFIEFIILLYIFLVISFAQYKKYMICHISLSTFSDVLPACTSARAIGNL